MAGPERKSRIITDAEKAIIAYHEGGHALVQRILPKCDPVAKVSIISRGMALGYTMGMPTEDRYLQSKTEFEDKIAGMLGGNAAERLIFGDTTTGSSNDIEKATNVARRMVTEFGMSDKLGTLAFGKRDELVFLGREIGEQRNYSDEVATQIDEEVSAIIAKAYSRAMDVLTTLQGPPHPAGRAPGGRGDGRAGSLRDDVRGPAGPAQGRRQLADDLAAAAARAPAGGHPQRTPKQARPRSPPDQARSPPDYQNGRPGQPGRSSCAFATRQEAPRRIAAS